MSAQVRIGCSGWSYPHWRKRFYPEKLPAREHFAYYAQHFDTVELNNSFYRQPPPERFVAWREQAPTGFLFAVKGSRYVSHVKRLVVEQKSVDLVVDSARGLGDKLGPILFQLQANFHLDLERLRRFLAMLPDDGRFAIDFRHRSIRHERVSRDGSERGLDLRGVDAGTTANERTPRRRTCYLGRGTSLGDSMRTLVVALALLLSATGGCGSLNGDSERLPIPQQSSL